MTTRSFSPHSPCCECRHYGPSDEDYIISQLKSEIFEREQNKRCLEDLECKFRQMTADMQNLQNLNNHLDMELHQTIDQGNKDIADVRNENENLLNDLNEKIAENKKLYCDNNNLFHELEDKTNENQCLHDQILCQESQLAKLNEDKINVERKRANLVQDIDHQNGVINNLKQQIADLTRETDDQCNQIRCKTNQLNCLIKQLADERNRNACLTNELRDKEEHLCATTHEFNLAKDCLNRLENDYTNLNDSNNKLKDNISNVRKNLMEETNSRRNFEDSNKKLADRLNCTENQIQRFSDENDCLQNCNNGLEIDNHNLSRTLEGYKSHATVLADQNGKLVQEMENIADRDNQVRTTLGRDDRLRQVRNQNCEIVGASRESVGCCLSPCRYHQSPGRAYSPSIHDSAKKSVEEEGEEAQ